MYTEQDPCHTHISNTNTKFNPIKSFDCCGRQKRKNAFLTIKRNMSKGGKKINKSKNDQNSYKLNSLEFQLNRT